jgi:site-specific recombinase XerD
MEHLVQTYLTRRQAARLAGSTIGLYRRHLTTWIEDRGNRDEGTTATSVNLDQLTDYFLRLEETPSRGKNRKPNTLASIYRAIRAFWNWCGKEGLLTADQRTFFERLDAPHVPKLPRESADDDLFNQMLDACGDPQASGKDGETAARNRALLTLLYETGGRISEVCNLTDAQLDHRRKRARIVGKGEKYRPLFWGPRAAAALAQYLLVRRGPRGGNNPLFRGTSIRNNGGKLTTDAARSALKRVAEDAGIELPKGAPLHCFRHGFARRARSLGADLSEIKTLMGHADIATTMIYLEGDEEEQAETYDRIFGKPGNGRIRRRDDRSNDG